MNNPTRFPTTPSQHQDDLLASARVSMRKENQQIYPAPQDARRQYDVLLERLDSKPSADEILAAYCA